MKENSGNQIQIGVAKSLLNKVHEILKSHVRHDESKIVSKEEITSLHEQLLLLDTMQEEFQNLKASKSCLKEHLETINNIQSCLAQITSAIGLNRSKVNKLQNEVISKSSDILYFSSS